MSHIHTLRDVPSKGRRPSVKTYQHVSHFWRHFFEMLGIMVAGMIATGAVFLAVVGLKTWDEITFVYPTQALVAMAFGMTVPMVAWMLIRGMGWKNTYEMALAMVSAERSSRLEADTKVTPPGAGCATGSRFPSGASLISGLCES
jgi:hypothetical protein